MDEEERLIELSGSHFEIGRQIGARYRAWGKKELYVPDISEDEFRKQLDIYERFFPKYLEWLGGISEGAGFEESRTRKSFLTGFLDHPFRPRKACSVIGLHTHGKVVVGRTYDWREAAEESARRISVTFTDGANAFTALSDMGVWKIGACAEPASFVLGTDDAWNEHGLFVCLNAAYGTCTRTGMNCTHVVQAVAEQCRSTDEAVDLLCHIPCNDPKFFTVIDRAGAMAIVEKPALREPAVIRSTTRVIKTNHYQSDAYKSENLAIFEAVPFHSTFARHAYLDAALDNMKTDDLGAIEQILLKPPVLQNWRGAANGDAVTAWLEVLELVSGEARVRFAPVRTAGQ